MEKKKVEEYESIDMQEIELKSNVPFARTSDFELNKWFGYEVTGIRKVKTNFGDKTVLILKSLVNEFAYMELSNWNFILRKPESIKIGSKIKIMNDGGSKLILELLD